MVVKNAAQHINLKSLLAGTYSRHPQRTNSHDIRDVLIFVSVAHCKDDICVKQSLNVQ